MTPQGLIDEIACDSDLARQCGRIARFLSLPLGLRADICFTANVDAAARLEGELGIRPYGEPTAAGGKTVAVPANGFDSGLFQIVGMFGQAVRGVLFAGGQIVVMCLVAFLGPIFPRLILAKRMTWRDGSSSR